MLCINLYKLHKAETDDDTASTVSTDSSFSNSVSFAAPLVTQVFERPMTTCAEKRDLYYSAADYKEFRYDLIHGGEPRDKVVKFQPSVVTVVHTYSVSVNKDVLYYSESDLQSFLDDFIVSLNEPSA